MNCIDFRFKAPVTDLAGLEKDYAAIGASTLLSGFKPAIFPAAGNGSGPSSSSPRRSSKPSVLLAVANLTYGSYVIAFVAETRIEFRLL